MTTINGIGEHEPLSIEREVASNAVRTFLQHILGFDPKLHEQTRDTPKRVVAAWIERTSGYRDDPKQLLKSDFPAEGYDEVVVLRDIEFVSSCEHHLLPFEGVAHVAYIPRNRVVGISKLARLVDCFARRLQIQERMGVQIADSMEEHLNPIGVAVVIESRHMCMSCRGVRKPGATMVTSVMRGAFGEPATPRQQHARAEVLALMRK